MFRYAGTKSESNTVRIYAVYSFVAQTFQFVSEERVYFWGNSHLTRRATATIA